MFDTHALNKTKLTVVRGYVEPRRDALHKLWRAMEDYQADPADIDYSRKVCREIWVAARSGQHPELLTIAQDLAIPEPPVYREPGTPREAPVSNAVPPAQVLRKFRDGTVTEADVTGTTEVPAEIVPPPLERLPTPPFRTAYRDH